MAAAATGLQYALASREFQIPETLGELKKQIEIFQSPVFDQQNGCNDPDKPFLVRYNQVGRKVCVSEDDLLSLRLDSSNCNTKVTLGDKIDGGCSQYNFFNRQGVSLSSFSNQDLNAEGVVVVPMHRNVAYYHKNSVNSPFIKTQLYYTSTKFLPCEMRSDFLRSDLVQIRDTDLKITGYCDVEPIVKEKLCWTGVGADADTTQEKLLDGSHFNTPDPCDVIQHVPQSQSNYRVPINNPDPKLNKNVVAENERMVQDEAFEQRCTKSGVTTLLDLERAPYYTGDGGGFRPYDYWANLNAPNKCSLSSSSCIDTDGEECTSDSDECSVYNVDQYTSVGLEKCFRKYITRTWTQSDNWRGRIMEVGYARKKDHTNWETYFKITPPKNNMNGDNACTVGDTPSECVSSCYERCKAMKFPGFSINPNIIDEKSCKCSDYSMQTCPEGQKVTVGTSRVSYTISPMCEDNKCDEKTRYSDKLRPCQFSEDYRKRKCTETCAAENALFMTISAGGLCLCSVAKRADNNKMVDLEGGDVCPWSGATRVYKNRNTGGIQRGKGYLGDSFVTTTPIETYQLVYNTYYGEEEDLREGILVCEAGGSPEKEIDDWYRKLTGASVASITVNELKDLYQN